MEDISLPQEGKISHLIPDESSSLIPRIQGFYNSKRLLVEAVWKWRHSSGRAPKQEHLFQIAMQDPGVKAAMGQLQSSYSMLGREIGIFDEQANALAREAVTIIATKIDMEVRAQAADSGCYPVVRIPPR